MYPLIAKKGLSPYFLLGKSGSAAVLWTQTKIRIASAHTKKDKKLVKVPLNSERNSTVMSDNTFSIFLCCLKELKSLASKKLKH
jgi:hypothetical protein